MRVIGELGRRQRSEARGRAGRGRAGRVGRARAGVGEAGEEQREEEARGEAEGRAAAKDQPRRRRRNVRRSQAGHRELTRAAFQRMSVPPNAEPNGRL